MGKILLRTLSVLCLGAFAYLQLAGSIISCDLIWRGIANLRWSDLFFTQALILVFLMIGVALAIYHFLWNQRSKLSLPEGLLLRTVCYLGLAWGAVFTAFVVINAVTAIVVNWKQGYFWGQSPSL